MWLISTFTLNLDSFLSVSLAASLAVCLLGSCLWLCVLAKIGWPRSKETSKDYESTLSKLALFRPPDLTRFCIVLVLLSLCCVFWVKASLADDRIYEYRDVRVVKVIDPYRWQLAKNDGEFVVTFCRDYDLSAFNPMPGLVMNKLRYADMGACASVKGKELGFWWKRDANGVAIQ